MGGAGEVVGARMTRLDVPGERTVSSTHRDLSALERAPQAVRESRRLATTPSRPRRRTARSICLGVPGQLREQDRHSATTVRRYSRAAVKRLAREVAPTEAQEVEGVVHDMQVARGAMLQRLEG